jgi:hypothetical protein
VDLHDFVELTLQVVRDGRTSGTVMIVHVRDDHTIDGVAGRPMEAGTWADAAFPNAFPPVRFGSTVVTPEFTVHTVYAAEAYDRRDANGPGTFDYYLLVGTYTSSVISEGERYERSGNWWAEGHFWF